MKQELDKCVLVIDEAMPRGLAANTAAILGITWGRLRPELVGEDVTDAAGAIHPGIIRTPVPVLSGRPETFQTLRRQLAELEFADVREDTRQEFLSIVRRMKEEDGIQAIVLGCTELPLILNDHISPVPCLDTMKIHVRALVKEIIDG